MKYIKIFESWSDDYVDDFKDNGFSIDEKGNKLTGKYKGKFIVSDINMWYGELVDRLDDGYEVVSSLISYNKITGDVSFNIEVSNKSNFITIKDNGRDVILDPYVIKHIAIQRNYFFISYITHDENGLNKTLSINKNGIQLGRKYIGLSIEMDQLIKLLNLKLEKLDFYNHQVSLTTQDINDINEIKKRIGE